MDVMLAKLKKYNDLYLLYFIKIILGLFTLKFMLYLYAMTDSFGGRCIDVFPNVNCAYFYTKNTFGNLNLFHDFSLRSFSYYMTRTSSVRNRENKNYNKQIKV